MTSHSPFLDVKSFAEEEAPTRAEESPRVPNPAAPSWRFTSSKKKAGWTRRRKSTSRF